MALGARVGRDRPGVLVRELGCRWHPGLPTKTGCARPQPADRTSLRRFNPAVVVDIATLTGACIVALGHHNIGPVHA